MRPAAIPENDPLPRVVRAVNDVFRTAPPQTAAATPPTTASDTGTPGDLAYSSTHLYVCVAANTWKRAALSTF